VTDIDIEEVLAALLSGETLAPRARHRLEAWLAEDPAHARELEEMRATWNLLGRRNLAVPEWEPLGDESLRRAASHRATPSLGRRLRRSWMIPAAAAAAAAAAVAAVLLLPLGDADGPPPAVYTAAPSATANVRLEDGTIASLAPGSRIEVEPGSNGRELTLEGQAFFAVVSSPDRPFRIHTAQGDVKVLGTRFDVRVHDDQLDLVVVDGRVELSRERQVVNVVGGEVSRIERGVVMPPVRVENVHALLPWMKGTMIFNSTPLSRVALEIEHRFGARVELAPSLANETVTAVLSDRPLGDVIEIVCGLVDAACSVESNGQRVIIDAADRTQ
jgi:transmembrane sensor